MFFQLLLSLLVILLALHWWKKKNDRSKTPSAESDGASTSVITSSRSLEDIPTLNHVDDKLGHLPDISSNGSLHEFLIQLHAQHGSIARFALPSSSSTSPSSTSLTHVVSLASPLLFKSTLKLFDRPSLLFSLLEPLIGKQSIQYANSEEGRTRRKLLDPFFSEVAFKVSIPTSHQHVRSMLQTWKDANSKTENEDEDWFIDVNILQETLLLEIKIICEVLFGNDTFTLEEAKEMLEAYQFCWDDLYQKLQGVRGPASTLGTLKQSKKGESNEPETEEEKKHKWDHALSVLHRFTDRVVANRRIALKEKTFDGGDKPLVDLLLQHPIYKDDDEKIRDDIISLFVGAFHTTANAITWLLYYIARDPLIQAKVHEELDAVLGEQGDDQTPPSLEQLSRLEYVGKAINETLRISQLGTFASRAQPEDGEIGGYLIPKDTVLLQALGVVAVDPTVWKEPYRFNPNRFDSPSTLSASSEETAVEQRHPLSYVPFGIGRRLCPAHRFAPLNLKMLTVEFLHRHIVSLTNPEKDGKQLGASFTLVATPERDLFLRFSPRR